MAGSKLGYLKGLVSEVRNSFWAIPLLLLICAGLLSVISVWVDSNWKFAWLIDRFPYPKAVDDNYLHTELATIAGAILGVAGVSFSITIASLTLASQQFGPRLIRTFIRNRFIQTTLGCFVATFFYCVFTIQLSSLFLSGDELPIFTVTVVIIITLLDLILLVGFIHHICKSIQVDSVISEVVRELNERALDLFKEEYSDSVGVLDDDIEKYHRARNNFPNRLKLTRDGYITYVNYDFLLEFACKRNIEVCLLYRAGQYVLDGAEVLSYSGIELTDEDSSDLLDCILIGEQRTPIQDIEYSIKQLVEIGLRALSPGINDPFTAISCINHLGSIINYFSHRAMPSVVLNDTNGTDRVYCRQARYEDLLGAAFDQLRQASCDKIDVSMRIVEVLSDVLMQCSSPQQAHALSSQVNLVLSAARLSAALEQDKAALEARFRNFMSIAANRFPNTDFEFNLPE